MLRSSWALVLVLSAAPRGGGPAARPDSTDGGTSSTSKRAAVVGPGGSDERLPVARLQSIDGGTLFDGGYTDLVELSVGASVELVFPRPVMLTVCDSPLVEVVSDEARLQLVGAEPGVTQCGFWFDRGAVPGRLVWVSVEP